VLDTGFDLEHPDFAGRPVEARSFIAGEQVQDGHGHGTHCIGTALGAKCPGVRPRYGIAYEADIYAGKVLSNAGSGADSGILAGIEWAVGNTCAVVSMSLGARVRPGQAFSQVFERVATRAQRQGTLIVAAAGNDSSRPADIWPVSHPANCPSIMAVAAIDVQGAIARFSNRGINPDGGQVDIAGPGVDVHSSWPMPTRYRRISGTSMATPHVAGIAALYAEADATARGAALGRALAGGALRLQLPSSDVGAGMVQAPQ
jgi:subtilisin family serine protease